MSLGARVMGVEGPRLPLSAETGEQDSNSIPENAFVLYLLSEMDPAITVCMYFNALAAAQR